MTAYGTAAVFRHADGSVVVEWADDTIGMTRELFAEMVQEPDGTLLLAGDPRYRYRPAGPAAGEPDVVVLHRVGAGAAEGVG